MRADVSPDRVRLPRPSLGQPLQARTVARVRHSSSHRCMLRLPRRISFVVVSLAAIACTASSAAAQSWSGGVKGGIGLSTFTGQHEFMWKPAGFSAIGFLNHRASDRQSLQAEFSLSQAKGVSLPGVPPVEFSAAYLNLPLLLRVDLPVNFAVKPFFMAGPNLSYRLVCHIDFLTAGLSSRTECINSGLSDLLDVGFAGGTGFTWKTRTATISVEGRGAFSLRNSVVPLPNSNSKNRSWNVVAGVSVPLHFKWRRPAVGPVPPGYLLVPVIGTLPEDLPRLPAGPASAPAASVPGSTRLITVTAVDADARSLLIAIAREAGINLAVSSDVQRRVSVSLTNAPADEAIAAIIAQAGLSISRPSAAPAVVFYQLAVNVNQAPAETIAIRFGISSDLAKWLVENRSPQSNRP